MRSIIPSVVVALAFTAAALAEDRRVDLREGHAIVDDASGRVEFFGSDGRRTGSGRVDGTGRRTDFFSSGGVPTGYTVTDPVSGRVDFYDAGGRIMGQGRASPDGRIERLGSDGVRLPDTVIPSPPRTTK